MTKHIFLASVSLMILAGCTQQAAPVVSGYDAQGVKLADYKPYRLKAMRAPASEALSVQKNTPTATVARQDAVAPTLQEEDLSRIEPAAGEQQPKGAFAPVEVRGDGRYTVQERDTLYKIARAHNVTARELMTENGLKSAADIRPGMVLSVPGHAVTEVAGVQESKPSSLNAVERAEAALAKLEGNREPEEPRIASLDVATETKLEQQAAAVEPAAGTLPETSLKQGNAAPKFVEHKVAAGETVYRISKQYNASVIDIMAANDFAVPQDLKAGTIVRVPLSGEEGPASAVTTVATTTTEKTTTITSDKPVSGADAERLVNVATEASQAAMHAEEERVSLMQKGRIDPLAAKAKGLAWPVKGKIIKKYGDVGQGVTHTGINIAVPVNTPVLAADGGSILYAGNGLKTYGNLVLIRHTDGMVTAYGHNGKLLVNKGETVKKGQVIALSGNSGNVGEPQLHFEIRKQAKAVDPLRVLASR